MNKRTLSFGNRLRNKAESVVQLAADFAKKVEYLLDQLKVKLRD